MMWISKVYMNKNVDILGENQQKYESNMILVVLLVTEIKQ